MKRTIRFTKIIRLSVLCFALFISLHTFSQSLDSSFGINGKQVIYEGNIDISFNSAFSTAQRNIVTDVTFNDETGYFPYTKIYKLKARGGVDNSFGEEGLIQLNGYGGKMIEQPDGKILVTWSYRDRNYSLLDSFFVARFLANGQYDATFGKGGRTAFHKKSNVSNAIALKSNGDIVITGSIITSLSGEHVAIIQLLPNGKVDTNFGTGGSLLAKTAYESNGQDIKVLPNNKMVVGYVYGNGGSAIAQYLPDGTIDSTVGVNGFIVNNDNGVRRLSIAVANNKLIQVTDYYSQTVIRRFLANGGVDNTFGTQGSVTPSVYYQTNISIKQNGDFFLAEYIPFVVTKFLSNGAVDSTYGSNGSVSADFTSFFSSSYAGAFMPVLQPNGRLVAVGTAYDLDMGSNNLAFAAFKNTTSQPTLMADFNATKNMRSVSLNWHPVSNLSTAYFIVERAGNQQPFSPIANITAKQISSVAGNYNFADATPASGVNNYRIKQVLTDGSTAYSKMIAVNFDVANEIMVTPNPAHEIVHIATTVTAPLQVKLMSQDGKVLKTFIVSSTYNLNITDLQAGIYFLYIESLQKSIKFIKE